MLRNFLVAFSAVATCTQAMAQQAAFQPSIRAQFNFGGAASSNSFGAHLSLVALREQQDNSEYLYTQPPQSVGYLAFRSSQSQGSALLALGSPVFVWGQAKQAEFALNQNSENTQSSGWFSRNWWLLGLGVVAVGVAVAAGGGGSDDQNTGTGDPPNCTVGSGNVGPAESPGVPLGQPCPGT